MHGLSTGTEKMAVSNVSILVSLVSSNYDCVLWLFKGDVSRDVSQ